jgi:uroporphyrinogen decarboxylase
VWQREHEGVMGFPRGFPLADLPRALKTYRWPDPDDERLCAKIWQRLDEWDHSPEVLLTGQNRDVLWEKAYMLVGMQDLMCYFYTEPEAVRELLHRITDFQLGIARHYADAGVELVIMSDDLGTQSGLLFSREILDEFFVPEYRRFFSFLKQHNILTHFHSCGHIMPVLDFFMDVGVDILNPIQATANDLDEVRRVTQGRMALAGGVSSGLLMSGPVEAIREEAVRRMWQLGREGGYFCGPDQGLPWPDEHIQALRDTVEECGRYPLQRPARLAA